MLFSLSAVAFVVGTVSALSAHDIPADTPLSSLLASAQTHLSRGETAEALRYYDAAIARDPADYLTYFKRATTYLSLGRSAQANDDFNAVLSLKPSFEAAHIQLGKIRQRVADWDGARVQFAKVKATPEVKELSKVLKEAETAARLADAAEAASDWEECVSQSSTAIIVANRALSLRQQRARCRFARGEVEEGAGDLQHVLYLNPGDVSPHLVISAVNFYALGDLEKGMAQVRKCLHSDPDSKPCRALLKQEKAVEKTLAKVDKALGKNQPSTAARNLVPGSDGDGLIREVKDQIQKLRTTGILPQSSPDNLNSRLAGLACQCYYEMNSKKAKEWCENALTIDDTSLYGLLYRHKNEIDAELFDAAIETLNKAKTAHPDKAGVIDPLINEAQVKLRRSKTKDYYKVLGVSHDADEKQIKSAYRKLTKIHHPDKAALQGLTKEDAEKKMASINEAYEVLSNPELRARFDQGDDPMSHEQPGQHQGNPFGFGGAGGQPFVFQQGGQQYKFRFGSNGFPFGH